VAISARNQLPGKVTTIHTGEVMAEVEVAVGDHMIVSVITVAEAWEQGEICGVTTAARAVCRGDLQRALPARRERRNGDASVRVA
jgi:molybdopterin-binding protein